VDIQPVVSIEKDTCFVTFLEESTHLTNLYCLKSKDQVLYYYKHYLNRMKNLTNRPGIANLYCDNGGEYMSEDYRDFVTSNGTVLHESIRDTSAQKCSKRDSRTYESYNNGSNARTFRQRWTSRYFLELRCYDRGVYN